MVRGATTAKLVASAAEKIRSRWSCPSSTAIILGTGLGELADEIASEAIIPYHEIPGFPRSTAPAHAGRLVCGHLQSVPLLALQGRCHLYEGHSPEDISFAVRVLAALGIKTLLVTNAAGGLNPNFAAGDVMLIEDHINWMGFQLTIPVESPCGRSVRRHVSLYDAHLAQAAMLLARRGGFPLQRGVYVAVTGPSYETRAEYRAFRRLGGDCVGMSTVPEVLTAAACGLRVLGLSTITNVASPDVPKLVSSDEVISVAATAVPKVRHLLHGLIVG